MTIFFLLLASLAALASEKDLLERTYPRDNSFCLVGKRRIEIMVRGDQYHTEPKERMWGEHILAKLDTGELRRLPVTQRSGLYRLFPGNPSACSKSIGTSLGGRFAILFQKLNSPHKHKLVIQYLNPKTLAAEETLYTDYLSDDAEVAAGSIHFRTFPPARQEIEMGKVTIMGKKYLYQDHILPIWVVMNNNGFSVEPLKTFENFSYRSFFSNVDEFKRATGWEDTAKKFTQTHLYVAINHAHKSRCILLLKEKKRPAGNEAWICQ